MADQEVIKHVKKTHQILTSKEHSLWHKVGEFILEIINCFCAKLIAMAT